MHTEVTPRYPKSGPELQVTMTQGTKVTVRSLCSSSCLERSKPPQSSPHRGCPQTWELTGGCDTAMVGLLEHRIFVRDGFSLSICPKSRGFFSKREFTLPGFSTPALRLFISHHQSPTPKHKALLRQRESQTSGTCWVRDTPAPGLPLHQLFQH